MKCLSRKGKSSVSFPYMHYLFTLVGSMQRARIRANADTLISKTNGGTKDAVTSIKISMPPFDTSRGKSYSGRQTSLTKSGLVGDVHACTLAGKVIYIF